MFKIPTLWRYLASQYFKMWALSVVSFISILLVTRLDEIANFASMGANRLHIFMYACYQLPYILPIAIPIASLIASLVLFQRLSDNYELVAMRSCGLSLKQIATPVLMLSSAIALLNLLIVSEVATSSHLLSKRLEYQLRSINPLTAIQNPHFLRLKGVHVEILGPSSPGESAEDVFILFHNPKRNRLDFFNIDQLNLETEDFIAKGTSLISTFASSDLEDRDNMMVENINEIRTPLGDFYPLLHKQGWPLRDDHLKMSLLNVRMHNITKKRSLLRLKGGKENLEQAQDLTHDLHRCYSEVARRISIALATFIFALMGCAYGTHIGRLHSKSNVFIVLFFALFYLSTFFAAKRVGQHILLAYSLYLIPNFLICFFSIHTLRRINKGIDS